MVHDDVDPCGFGAEIAAWATDELFEDPGRAGAAGGGPRHARAHEPTLEDAVLSQVADVVATARTILTD